MSEVCWYLQLHQPYRLRDFTLFDIGQHKEYFSHLEAQGNGHIFKKVARKSYLPMLQLLIKLVQTYPEFKVTLSCSGVFLEQAQRYQPKVIKLLQVLAATDQVEFLAETYYHSLACLYSPTEFVSQVNQHTQLLQTLFHRTPTVFRNTELVYDNHIAKLVGELGFTGMLTEAVERHLHGRPRTSVYKDISGQLPLLLKHAQLSDDIAFRFSDQNWQSYPLTASAYVQWLEQFSPEETVNLFMDFETFGEHQWASTGIFEFVAAVVKLFLQSPHNRFVTPREKFNLLVTQEQLSSLPRYDVPQPISWADVDRDLTAWTENAFQQDCLRLLYQLQQPILKSGQPALIERWRKLQTSDHFYYMCTKWSADGDVHAYFSPYKDPYEAYRRYSLVLQDLQQAVTQPRRARRHSLASSQL